MTKNVSRLKVKVFADTYRGIGLFTCDQCGLVYPRSQMFTRWDNAKVDRKCNDPRPPEMQPPTPTQFDGLPFWDARPQQGISDRLTDDTYLVSTAGGVEATLGQIPNTANTNPQPGAYSPRPIITGVPGQVQDFANVNTNADRLTLRTGPVFQSETDGAYVANNVGQYN